MRGRETPEHSIDKINRHPAIIGMTFLLSAGAPRLAFETWDCGTPATNDFFCGRPLFFVDFAPVANLQDEYDQAVVLEAADEPVIANPIAPQACQAMSQWLAKLPGIFRPCNPLAQIAKDMLLSLRT